MLVTYPTDQPEVAMRVGPYEVSAAPDARAAAGRFPLVALSHGQGSTPLVLRTLALQLAREPECLAALRARLARNRQTHPLFDTVRFTRQIEAAFAVMWERSIRGEAPESFTIAMSGAAP